MEKRIYHGDMTPQEVATALVARFNRGNLKAQQLGSGSQIIVQIASGRNARSGGQTAISVTLQNHEDGVLVQIGKQAWYGLAASLGVTALGAIRNPFSLLGRLDDLAQDIENLQMTERIWETVAEVAKTLGASQELSDRLRRIECEYCAAANQPGQSSCIACGAPLGRVQLRSCLKCGFVLKTGEYACPNCKKKV
jgi:hypothetical protein